MRNVVLYIAMSLDGYIADPGGGVSWLQGHGPEDNDMGSYPEFIETVDTVILGYRTYHQLVTELSPGNWNYQGMTSYVMTHRKMDSADEIFFTDESIPDLVNRLKDQVGKDIWICGGADIVNQLMEENLIDRYHITVIPIVLGDGIRLFRGHEKQIALDLVSTQRYHGMVDIVYKKSSQIVNK